jgi:hypothetical protein
LSEAELRDQSRRVRIIWTTLVELFLQHQQVALGISFFETPLPVGNIVIVNNDECAALATPSSLSASSREPETLSSPFSITPSDNVKSKAKSR